MKFKRNMKRILSLVLCISLITSLFVGQMVPVGALSPNLDKELSDYAEKVNVYHFYQYSDDPDTGGHWANGPWAQAGVSYIPLWQYDPVLTGLENSLLNTNYFRSESGEVAYCMNYGKATPSSTLSIGSEVPVELRRVLLNGYPVKNGSDYGISDIELEWATSVALQIVDGNGYNSTTGELVAGTGLQLEYFNNGVFSLTYSKENYPNIPDDILQAYTQQAEKVKGVIEQLVAFANDETVEFDSLKINAENTKTNIPVDSNSFSFGPYTVDSSVDNLSYNLTSSVEGVDVKVVDENNNELKAINSNEAFYIKGKSDANFDLTFEVYSKDVPVYPSVYFVPENENEQDMYIVAPLKLADSKTLSARKDIELFKNDTLTKKPVSGAKISVKDITEKEVFSGVTDDNGKVVISGLNNGTYNFAETNIVDGYIKNNKTYSFTIAEDGSVTGDTSFSNVPTEVIVTKYDTEDKKPLEGAKIAIINSDDEVVSKGVTDKNGEFKVSYLPIGKYKFLETSAPDGYSRVDNYFHFEILENGTVSGETSFGNTPNKVVISKINSKTSTPVKGAVFSIIGIDIDYSQAFSTDENGEIVVKYIPSGSYYFEELTAPEGYIKDDNKYNFTIDENGVVTGTTKVSNTPISRKVIVTKMDAETKQLLSNAKFDVFAWDASQNKYSEEKYCSLTNNNDGTYSALLTYNENNCGKFKVVETEAPQGYLYEEISEEISILPNQNDTAVDYTSDIKLTVMNKINNKKILAEIRWIDNNNAYNTRPDIVKLTLSDGYLGMFEKENKDETYSYEFSNLTIYKDKDTKYEYKLLAENTIHAKNDDLYNLVSIEKDDNSAVEKYIVTYKLDGKIDINGTVLWEDQTNIDGLRPAYVDVSLERKDPSSDKKDSIAAEKTLSKFNFGSFSKYNDEGIRYEYYVSQNNVEYYSTSYRDDIVISSELPFAYNQNSNLEILNVYTPVNISSNKTLTLIFNNIFTNNGNNITEEDYANVALSTNSEYNFPVTLKNIRNGKEFNATLNSLNQLIISGLEYDKNDSGEYLAETTYEISITGNQYFSFKNLSLAENQSQNIKLKEEDGKYYIIASSDVSNIGYGYLVNNMDIVDWRGYSSLSTTNDHEHIVTPISDFEYNVSTNSITLTKYIGKSSKVIVPAVYYINDVKYDVVIAKASTDNNVFLDSNAKYVTFEEGATFEENNAQYAFANTGIVRVSGMPTQTTNMDYAFLNAKSLKAIDKLPPFVVSMEGCFKGCSKLINAPNFDRLPSLKNINSVFEGCVELTKAPSLLYCTNISTANNAFYGCSKLQGYVPIGSKNIVSASNIFGNTSHVITVCVPSESESYAVINTIYKEHKNIVIVPII